MPDGSPGDGGIEDAGPEDGGTDAGPDGSMPDGGPIPMVDCTVLDDPPLDFGLDRRAADRPAVVVAGPDEFGVAWIAQSEVADVVRFRRVDSRTGEDRAIQLAEVGLTSGRASITRFSDGRFLVGWTDNSPGNFELHLQSIAADGTAAGSPSALTNAPGRDDESAMVTTADNRALITWVRTDALGGTAEGYVQAVDAAGSPQGSAVPLGGVVDPLTLVPDGPTAYWRVSNRAQSRRIAEGGFTGTTQRLDTEENVIGRVVSARAGSQFAATFPVLSGVRSELRFRPLDDMGVPRAPERVVTPAPEQGFGAAMGPLGGGNVIAYRSQASSSDDATVRLRFVTDLGHDVGFLDVADTTVDGGAVALGVAGDGRMLVVWGTRETDGIQRRAARVECSDAF